MIVLVGTDDRPPPRVLTAYGLNERELRRVPGGQGRTWRTDGAVLKPHGSVVEAQWTASLLDRMPVNGFRIERPLASRWGTWCVEGWTAWDFIDGRHEFDRWSEVFAAARALHRALEGAVPRPQFLDERDDPWALADRVAWGEAPPRMHSVDLEVCAIRLAQNVIRTQQPSQIVHGDVTGNVLFGPTGPPAIIDFTPYWRPALYADAIIAVDALCWHGAAADIVDLLEPAERASMIARAALFRLFTADRLAVEDRRGDPAYLKAQVHAADLIGDLLDGPAFRRSAGRGDQG